MVFLREIGRSPSDTLRFPSLTGLCDGWWSGFWIVDGGLGGIAVAPGEAAVELTGRVESWRCEVLVTGQPRHRAGLRTALRGMMRWMVGWVPCELPWSVEWGQ